MLAGFFAYRASGKVQSFAVDGYRDRSLYVYVEMPDGRALRRPFFFDY
jgi:hypothetical protein